MSMLFQVSQNVGGKRQQKKDEPSPDKSIQDRVKVLPAFGQSKFTQFQHHSKNLSKDDSFMPSNFPILEVEFQTYVNDDDAGDFQEEFQQKQQLKKMKTTVITPEKIIQPAEIQENFMTSFKKKLMKGLNEERGSFKLASRTGKTATKASFTLDQLEVLRKLRLNMRKMFVKKSVIIQEKNYDKVVFENMDNFEKLQEDFNVDWNERKKKIMKNFKANTISIQRNSPMVQSFHVDKYCSDKDSVGSVSCDDEGDIEIVLNGEHQHFFQAFKLIKKFDQLKEKQIQQIEEEQNSLSQQIQEKLCCKKKRAKKDKFEVLQDQLKIELKQKVIEHKDYVKQKRTGKELWKIARKLVMKPKTNWAQLINQTAKFTDTLKQQQEFEEIQQLENLGVLQDGKDYNQGDNGDQAYTEQLIEFGQKGYIMQTWNRFLEWYHEKLIEPTNKKLQYFHIIVSITLFYDFFLTGLIMGNYPFYLGEIDDFNDHVEQYEIICSIQIMDIFLNFFKIEEGQSRKKIANPLEIFNQYFKGNFIIDVIAVIPYTMFNIYLIPLRYLKLIKFNMYLNYLQIYVFENFLVCFNQEQNKIVMSMLRLLIQVIVVSHFFACIWALIGQYNLENYQTGWIHLAMESQYQINNYSSIYLTAFYWVITTFTSVGYGDILGVTQTENLFCMVVEMVGIGFFGYIVGTFQNLISSFGVTDQLTELMEKLDQNLMKLDKTVKDRVLIPSIYQGVQEFTELRYKNDAIDVQDQEFFQILKPRLQRELIDQLFQNYYELFKWIFQETDPVEPNFKRDVFRKCKFYYCPKFNEDDKDHLEKSWTNLDEIPSIIEAGKFSEYVYFILQGQINIMSQDGLFDYGQLQEGSYFGDISILLNQPNQFSYFYDPFCERPTLLLQIEVNEFLRICQLNPLSYAEMINKAQQRQEMFILFKTQILIKFMKTIKKDPSITTPKFLKNQLTMLQNIQKMKYYNDKLVLVDLSTQILYILIEQYEFKRMHVKIMKLENENQKEKFAEQKRIRIIQEYDQNEYYIVNYEEETEKNDQIVGSKLLDELRKMDKSSIQEQDEEQARIQQNIYHEEQPQQLTQQTKSQILKQLKGKIANEKEILKKKKSEEMKKKMCHSEEQQSEQQSQKFELPEEEPLRVEKKQPEKFLEFLEEEKSVTAGKQLGENSSFEMSEKLESVRTKVDQIEVTKQITVTAIEPSPNKTIFNGSSNLSNKTEKDATKSPQLIDERERDVLTPNLLIQKRESSRPNKSVNFQPNVNLPKIELEEVLVDFETSKKKLMEDEKINMDQRQQQIKAQELQIKKLQQQNQYIQSHRQYSPSLVPKLQKKNIRPQMRMSSHEEIVEPLQRRFTIVPREQYLAQRQDIKSPAKPEPDASHRSNRTRTQRGFQSRQNKKPQVAPQEQPQQSEESKQSNFSNRYNNLHKNYEGGKLEQSTPKFGRTSFSKAQQQSLFQSKKQSAIKKNEIDATSNHSKESYVSKDQGTIDLQKAIIDNKHNTKRALQKYFVRKGITEIKRERLRENDLKRLKELEEFKEENEISEDADQFSDCSQEHSQDGKLKFILELKQEMQVNPLKYLDKVIDEYIDLILVDHNLQKQKNEESKKFQQEFPLKPFDSLKQSRQNLLNSTNEQDIQDFDRKYHSQSLFKILLIRDLFKKEYGEFDNENYATYAQSMQRQLQANQCFKTLFDGSMTDLNDTFRLMKDNITTKMDKLVIGNKSSDEK